MTLINSVFPRSKDLKEIIESFNWTLYDMSGSPKDRAYSFEELDNMTPASQYMVGHNYLFVPMPENGQTLRQAYSLTKGLGPSLSIVKTDDDRFLTFEVCQKSNGAVALFSRLFLHETCAFLTTPKTTYLMNPDFVAINYDYLIDTFQKYFRIVLPEEYGLKTPIPPPPQLN